MNKRTHNMAVSIATYGYRCRFVDNHNVLVDMNEGDGLARDRYLVPATIHTSGFWLPQRAPDTEQTLHTRTVQLQCMFVRVSRRFVELSTIVN